MSVITRARSLGRHRGKTPLELRIALDAADDRATRLTAALDQLGAANTTLERLLDQAGIDYSGALEDVATRDRTIAQLEGTVRLRDQQIDDLKRKVDVGVKAEHVIAKTQPIPVLPLGQAPFVATDPAHIPAITVT